MTFKEVEQDLFSVPNDYHLVQCISSDFVMGKGIAVEFNKRFNIKKEAFKLYPNGYKDCNSHHTFGCMMIDRTLNLITKERYFEKPTYNSLEQSLYSMRDICQNNNIKKIAMPTIGCGLDKLNWNIVSDIIKRIFKDEDIEILVCKL